MPIDNNSEANVESVALSRFANGFNCSQAVFSAFAAEFGMSEEAALKIAAGFGGGIGRTGGVCGAVTGAIMALGLKFGSAVPSPDAKELAYSKTREFIERFKTLNGLIACRDLLGCDISTPEGFATAKAKDLFKAACPKYVKDAVKIVEEMAGD